MEGVGNISKPSVRAFGSRPLPRTGWQGEGAWPCREWACLPAEAEARARPPPRPSGRGWPHQRRNPGQSRGQRLQGSIKRDQK
eukprot:scaffold12300_cov132-Isochrysis_galbana.AAC.11